MNPNLQAAFDAWLMEIDWSPRRNNMNNYQRQLTAAQLRNDANASRTGGISRRRALQLAGGLGIALAGGAVVAATGGTSGGSGSNHSHAVLQAGTPPAAATPQVGEREDGTHLWHVTVGGMDMENLIDVQAFLPGEITINAGDAIWFEFDHMPGFHTVTFTSGQEPPPLFLPDADAATPAAAPPTLVVNPDVLFPVGGDTYDGTGYLNSGADILRDPTTPPFVLTFTRPGTYDYYCVVHAMVMKAQVIVQEAGAELPHDQAAYDRMAEEQFAALVEEGLAATEQYAEPIVTEREDGTTLWEVAAGAGEGQARVFRMLPDVIEIGVGDTIRWVNHSPGEPHTVTFLGGEEPPQDFLVEPRPDGSPKFIQNNLTLLPQGGAVFSGTGYHNSGFMGPEFVGIEAYELTFDTPGEFDYLCILHGSPDGTGMAAKVIVTEGS